MSLYLETSALVRAAIYAQPDVVERMEAADTWVTSALTLLECERALITMPSRKRLTRAGVARAHAFLREVAWTTEISELDQGLFDRVTRQFPVEPVRTLDALHLATILRWAERGPVEVLTCDQRVRLNAEAFGFPVFFFPAEPLP